MRAIKYLSDWYEFENPPFEKFKIFNLESKLAYCDISKVAQELFHDSESYINFDDLYNEICIVNEIIPLIKDKRGVVEKWTYIFKEKKFPNLVKIVQPILSISVSTANVERVFSLMNQSWTDNRNRMNVELVKAELVIKSNFSLNCKDFYEYIAKNKKLLKSVSKSEKYV